MPPTAAAAEPDIAAPSVPHRPPLLAVRLAVQLFLAYGVLGAWYPVFSDYLRQRGFTPTETAWAFATYSLCSLFAPIFWGQVADRWLAAERCIGLCALACAGLLWSIPHLPDADAVIFVSFVLWFFLIPIFSLGTALTFRQLEHPERDYGRVRLWGTVGWVAVGLVLSLWLKVLRPLFFESDAGGHLEDSLYLGGISALLLAGYALTLPLTPPLPPSGRGGALLRLLDAPLQALRMCRERAFLVYCACLFGLYATMPFQQQVTPLLLRSLGIGKEELPAVLTLMQVMEITMLALLPALLGRLGQKGTMVLGVSAWTLGMSINALGEPTALVVAGMGTHGVFICCFLVAGQVFVDRRAARNARASAQGLIVLISGVGQLAGHLLVGAVRDATGDDFPRAFVPAAVVAAAVLTTFVVGFRPGRDQELLVRGERMT